MAMNKVLMVGRLTADPELRQTDSGIEVTRFSLAVSMGTNKTDFFNIVAWRQTATFITRYFHKSDGICIDGHLSSRQYEKDGVKHTVYEVIVDSAGFSEGRASTEGAVTTQPQPDSYQQRLESRARGECRPSFEDATILENESGIPF